MAYPLKTCVIAVGLLLLGLGLLLGADRFGEFRILCVAGSFVAIAISMIIVLSGFNDRKRSPSFFRLDHYLPFLRRNRIISGRPNVAIRFAKKLLPRKCFFDPVTGKEGLIRKFLRRLGNTVLASPFRRLSQGIFLALFSWSFFYICWPYGLSPQKEGKFYSDLKFENLDQHSGQLTFTIPMFDAHELIAGQSWHLSQKDAFDKPKSVGSFVINAIDETQLSLRPLQGLTTEQLDAILLDSGIWELHEKEPGKWPSHHADHLARKEFLPAELLLIIDPLVSLSTAIASQSWVWSLVAAGAILVACVLIPRGFCGYICPLGTVIDLFDRFVGARWQRWHLVKDGWWVHIKYYLLGGVLMAAFFGVLISGYFSAIPIITRAFLFIGDPIQTGFMRGTHLIAPMNTGHWISIVLFFTVLALGFLKPRFWCKYVCPSGAVFSIGNLFRISERKVESSCIHCNKCVTVCPFDAIKPDFTTRTTDCTLCQTCGGVCPTHAIKFVDRWNAFDLKPTDVPSTNETALGRRGFLSLVGGTALGVTGGIGAATVTKMFGARLDVNELPPVRPPGSVPEEEFLQMCIRCGECFKACPNHVLQSMGIDKGLDRLWTPEVIADWAGCESSCNACGQVCPTGAIRTLPIEEKKVARMGLAIVNTDTCLPFAEREACQLCVDECAAAGYHAIEFTRVGTQADNFDQIIPESGYLAPRVLEDQCVGCGLCQTRCHGINVEQKNLLKESAIIIEAGPGKEDRMMHGSYLQLRQNQTTSHPTTIQDQPTDDTLIDPFDEAF
ncbi:MAG: 4Fe-4S binding protein [Verrucomicrobia bacterium]|jgi:ferredoxin|nr:4Fe-4S binding protein [Verrucomicrobiota bacterium]